MTYVHASDRLWAKASCSEVHPRGLLARMTHALELRRARRELAELPPHLLRDVGLVDQVRHDTQNHRKLVAEIERSVASTGAVW